MAIIPSALFWQSYKKHSKKKKPCSYDTAQRCALFDQMQHIIMQKNWKLQSPVVISRNTAVSQVAGNAYYNMR